MNRLLCLWAIVIPLTGVALPGAAQPANEDPKDIITVHIRKQGYACEKPRTATRDAERSKAGSAVWTLKCETATYRVRLVPDLAAHVERIE